MEQPIYKQICDNVKDGILCADFSFKENETDDASLKWAMGALDGMSIYHMPSNDMNDTDIEEMAKALKSATSDDFEKTDELFYEWTKKNRAIEVIDVFEGYVMDHQDELNAGSIYKTAVYLISSSTHIECVKIGMELLELISVGDEKIKEMIRTLGLCDEFTVFAAYDMNKWDNGNAEIFDLAKKVRGWGRIHCVELLQPDSNEIKHWLLTEGTINNVMNAYSSLTCFEKSGAHDVLFGSPTYEEYHGISTIIEGLIDQGPVRGISGIDDARDVLMRFLEISEYYDLNVSDYDVILSIRMYAADKGKTYRSVLNRCDEILHSLKCETEVKESVKQGKGLRLADELNIPFTKELFECLKNDFDGNYRKCLYLMADEDYVDQTIELFKERLPLSKMEGEPSNEMGYGEEYKAYDQLQFMLQELASHPLKGVELIKAGLRSPISRNRYCALYTLKDWVYKKKEPLNVMTPEIFEIVKELKDKEVYDQASKIIEQLVQGKTEISDSNSFKLNE